MTPESLAWLNLLLLPGVGLLLRITGQLATLTAVQEQHAARILNLERGKE
jgi:hypothetical protein